MEGATLGEHGARKLRVLVVTNMWPSATRPARGSFVQGQVEALKRGGQADVKVFAFDASGRPWRYVTAAARLAVSGLRPDIVHAHYGLSGLVALTAAARCPLVLTVHGRDCHHPLVRRITSFVGRRATVVAVSRELAAICPVPVADVIPPGADLERFRPMDRRQARERLGLPLDERMLLFPADPARPEKRWDLALRLVESLGGRPPVGPGDAAIAPATVGELPQVRLRALRNVPPAAAPLWVNAADAVVIPSDREGYGLACVEALACDVPVLSTPVGIARQLLPSVPGTLCAPFDLRLWRDHVLELMRSDDPRVESRGAVEPESADAATRRLVALYRRLIDAAQ